MCRVVNPNIPPLPLNPTKEQIDAQLVLIREEIKRLESEKLTEWPKC